MWIVLWYHVGHNVTMDVCSKLQNSLGNTLRLSGSETAFLCFLQNSLYVLALQMAAKDSPNQALGWVAAVITFCRNCLCYSVSASRNRADLLPAAPGKQHLESDIGVRNEGRGGSVPLPSVMSCRQFPSCFVNDSQAVAHKGGFIRRQKGR